MIYHPCTEDGQRCIQTPSTGLRHPSLTAREVVCSHRSLQLIVRPTSDCHDWLYDQSQIAMAGCTTNHRLPRLVVRPITDRYDWLYDQSQIATAGCTTNRRLPRLVVRPITDCHGWLYDQSQLSGRCTASAGMSTSGGAGCISTYTFTTGCTTNHRLPQLVVRPTTALWGWHLDARPVTALCWLHGLCWHVHFRRCRVHIYMYIHLPFGIQFFCIWMWPLRPSFAFLGRHFFSTACSVRKLKGYRYWRFTEGFFICEGRPVVRLCNWSWLVATGRPTSTTTRMTNRATDLATTNRRSLRLVARLVVRPYMTCLLPPTIWFGIAKPVFWIWPSTLLRLICL